jgi:hypothetical protein
LILTGWIFGWLGIWRLTRRPPRSHDSRQEAIWRWMLRIAATLYLLTPLIWWAGEGARWAPGYFRRALLTCLIAGAFATVSLYQHLRHLAIRLPSTALQVLFGLAGGFCTGLSSIVIVILVSNQSDSAEFIRYLPQLPLGSPSLMMEPQRWWESLFEWELWTWVVTLTLIGAVIGVAWFSVVLFVHATAARKQQRRTTLSSSS